MDDSDDLSKLSNLFSMSFMTGRNFSFSCCTLAAVICIHAIADFVADHALDAFVALSFVHEFPLNHYLGSLSAILQSSIVCIRQSKDVFFWSSIVLCWTTDKCPERRYRVSWTFWFVLGTGFINKDEALFECQFHFCQFFSQSVDFSDDLTNVFMLFWWGFLQQWIRMNFLNNPTTVIHYQLRALICLIGFVLTRDESLLTICGILLTCVCEIWILCFSSLSWFMFRHHVSRHVSQA